PMPMASALTSRLEVAALERLVARGLVMISGVTPSDAAHVLGRLDTWDGAAAEKALRLIARRRTGAGERFAPGPEAFAQAVVDQLTQQTVDCLLEAAFGEDPAFAGEAPEMLARHHLTTAGLARHRGVVELSLRLGVPVIGLGASAPSYYGAVGERLNCPMILPDHAGVANAIGAVAGQVSQRATGIVTSPAEGRFVAHLSDGLQSFASAEAALSALEAALIAEASTRARASGAVDLRIALDREVKEVEIEGRQMFIEARVTATASGRPRVAR
ncbi:MAG: hydantoinase/oxoprolinase family protein, partial [Tabrizicola sp.]